MTFVVGFRQLCNHPQTKQKCQLLGLCWILLALLSMVFAPLRHGGGDHFTQQVGMSVEQLEEDDER